MYVVYFDYPYWIPPLLFDMACETNIILAQEVFFWYSTQRYGFTSAPISNGGYISLFIMVEILDITQVNDALAEMVALFRVELPQ